MVMVPAYSERCMLAQNRLQHLAQDSTITVQGAYDLLGPISATVNKEWARLLIILYRLWHENLNVRFVIRQGDLTPWLRDVAD
jgi:hypothetical protein